MRHELLKVGGLTKRFGGLTAVSDVSLTVARGEIHAVIGPNGAGKSSLINLLSGDLMPTSGNIMLEGRDITAQSPNVRCRAGIGRSYQKTTIFQERTVGENVRIAAQGARPGSIAMWRSAQQEATNRRAVEAALSDAGLVHQIDTPARMMSHGEQRQLEVAMVLATDPRIVLLDEPLAGMGHGEAKQMAQVISALKDNRGVLLVEHDMDVVFAIADRLTVMADGQVIASGPVDEVRRDPKVRAAYLGEGEEAA
ncbi:ABC transporter ATP-binding protein [Agrobacterium genomosp. 3]|jgi:branched-chain amino acid transport system ATP-binding protein|uniref:ABC transporter ATP-binding protein n=1 Tax=Agrobacterium TaxID=357 RepID=UPI0011D5C895|nr:ABC transporter ATP-binding protein [Agrobacterium pusense]MCA1867950.1 ABC transporter ATP-binding protein [Agrobacterium tomkonis]MCA1878357.1 ABC transporter ATP-binding protein [Agrobacterium tumefaciens]TXI02973.1 MAG: ABC transporter ATP-binding protein [Rhizobium sp.]MCA1893525.1 ABC transporter ATP-binding protein [Agrobacterium tomkonis]MDH0117057.1 ABC transporter ATP-binding protein [Agrobacterium pusense]